MKTSQLLKATKSGQNHQKICIYVSAQYTEGETYRFTSHRSFLCHISFVSVRSVLSFYHAGGQTRDVDPMSGYCWPTV